jgi:peptidoglycan/LPS O-acetylase OafA/YrhL
MDTRALDGLRALLNMWILVFHSMYLMMYFLPKRELDGLVGSTWVVQHGYLAVDGFFVLTGFLLAVPLVQSLRSAEPIKTVEYLKRYYANRLVRIMLPYLLTAALYCFVVAAPGAYRTGLVRLAPARDMFTRFFGDAEFVDNSSGMSPANVLHLNMLMPFNGFMIHTWSVGVQYHAYLWLPAAMIGLRVRSWRRCVALAGVAIAAMSALRVLGQWHQSKFEAGGVINTVLELWWYSNTLLRLPAILVGVVAAWLAHDSSLPLWLSQRSVGSYAAHAGMWLLTAAFFPVNTGWKNAVGDYRYEHHWLHSLFFGFLSVGSVLSGVVWAWIILCAVYRWGVFAPSSLWSETVAGAPAVHSVAKSQVPAGDDAGVTRVDDQPAALKADGLRQRKRAPMTTDSVHPAAATVAAKVSADNASSTPAPASTIWGLNLGALLSSAPLKVAADLSYWSYLLHVCIYVKLYSDPHLLYPPSGSDFAPAALFGDVTLANGTVVPAVPRIANSNVTYVLSPDPTGQGMPIIERLLAGWVRLREVALPSGSPITLPQFWLVTIIGALITYAACYVLMHCVETPLRIVLLGRWKRQVTAVAWWYSLAVMAIGVLAHVGMMSAIVVWLQPEHDASWAPPAGAGNATADPISQPGRGVPAPCM